MKWFMSSILTWGTLIYEHVIQLIVYMDVQEPLGFELVNEVKVVGIYFHHEILPLGSGWISIIGKAKW